MATSETDPPGPLLGDAMQLAYVVRDLDRALGFWTDTLGVGPFIQVDEMPPAEFVYRGRRVQPAFRMAYSFVGRNQISVLEPTNDEPCPQRDLLDSGRQGLEHIGFWSRDVDEAARRLEARGVTRCFEVRMSAGRVLYFDPTEGFDTRIGLLDRSPVRERLYDALRALVRDWDRSRPVRRYPAMADFLKEEGIELAW